MDKSLAIRTFNSNIVYTFEFGKRLRRKANIAEIEDFTTAGANRDK
jgi:hypothetical protein